MIENDTQLAVTKDWIARFRSAIEAAKNTPPGKHSPAIRRAQIQGMESQLSDLRTEVKEYEAKKR